MPFTASQICSQARAIARTPGLTTANGANPSSGDLLNLVLSDLCQTYDFAVALGTATVNLSGIVGSGPYNLPTNYLRMAQDEVFYLVNGTPYVMVNESLAEFDAQVQNAGINNFPEFFATNPALSPPGMFVWPPSAINTGATIRYWQQMPDIVTPETSSVVPWFPNTNYLITRLAGEIMKQAGDERADMFLGKGEAGAQGLLTRFLKLQADDEGRAQVVELDRRRFGSKNFSRLNNTKLIGWALACSMGLVNLFSVCYHPIIGEQHAQWYLSEKT
jgi:hypothetical protein